MLELSEMTCSVSFLKRRFTTVAGSLYIRIRGGEKERRRGKFGKGEKREIAYNHWKGSTAGHKEMQESCMKGGEPLV